MKGSDAQPETPHKRLIIKTFRTTPPGPIQALHFGMALVGVNIA
jgi:hypothetical protein